MSIATNEQEPSNSLSAIALANAHRLRPLANKPSGTLLVHEIYRSLQGESTFAGLPCVFIRLTACHLRCVYCDTPHAFNQGRILPVEDVVSQALSLGDDLIELTGGEPLLQPEAPILMTRLADAGKTVLLETSGAVLVDTVDPRVHIIMDVKTPDSGEAAANLWSNFDHLKPSDEIKFVICSRADFEWSIEQVKAHRLHTRHPLLFSAAFGEVNPTDLAAWILETRLPLRLQLQQHKILWDPMARGV